MDTPKAIESIHLRGFVKQHNHFCQMQVEYADGSEETLVARVLFNPLTNQWSVDGLKVAIRLK